jgi:hypothetical protein
MFIIKMRKSTIQNKIIPDGYDQDLILKFFCSFVDQGIDEQSGKKKPAVSWKCNLCNNGQVLDCKAGFTNIFKHICETSKHSQWKFNYEHMKNLLQKGELNGPMDKFVTRAPPSDRGKQVNQWVRMVVLRLLPFEIVEDIEYRHLAKYEGISVRFLKKVK